MREHHKRTIEKLVERFKSDERFAAMIVAGSIAKGREVEGSDVDVFLVATEEEFNRRAAENDYSYIDDEICDAPGVYAEAKIVDLNYLRECAERGSEVARAEFVGSYIAYSRIPGLEKMLERIPAYPEHEREEKINGFFAQVKYLLWLTGEAEKRNDRYLLVHCAAELVLFGGRLILAHNRILFPAHKWFMYELRNAPEKPENILELAEKLLAHPSKENAKAFGEAVLNFTEWEKPAEGWVKWFLKNIEWSWRKGRPPIQYW